MFLYISELGLGKPAEFSESAHFENKQAKTPMKSSDSLSSVDKLQADFKTRGILRFQF